MVVLGKWERPGQFLFDVSVSRSVVSGSSTTKAPHVHYFNFKQQRGESSRLRLDARLKKMGAGPREGSTAVRCTNGSREESPGATLVDRRKAN